MEADERRVEAALRALVRDWGLSRFSEEMAWRWIRQALGADDDDAQLAHVRKWIWLQIQPLRVLPAMDPWQRGCPEIIPELRARAVWGCDEFPWVESLEKSFAEIKKELLALKGQKGFQPYRAPTWASDIHAKDGLGSVGHDAGDWNVFYLHLHNMDFAANRALCPTTVATIESIEGHYEHAFFSALAPSTHIKKHHGPTNKKLRCHLPLVVPKGKSRLRVGNEIIQIEEGKCYIFDDSFEHEAWNDDPDHARIVLIVDVWHPDLSAPEKKFLSFLRNSQLRMGKKLAQDSKDSFFSIIEEANQADMSAPAAIWS